MKREIGHFLVHCSLYFKASPRSKSLLGISVFIHIEISRTKAWFKRRILHTPNQILILVDSNEYVRLI